MYSPDGCPVPTGATTPLDVQLCQTDADCNPNYYYGSSCFAYDCGWANPVMACANPDYTNQTACTMVAGQLDCNGMSENVLTQPGYECCATTSGTTTTEVWQLASAGCATGMAVTCEDKVDYCGNSQVCCLNMTGVDVGTVSCVDGTTCPTPGTSLVYAQVCESDADCTGSATCDYWECAGTTYTYPFHACSLTVGGTLTSLGYTCTDEGPI